MPAYSETAYRIAMFGDEIEDLTEFEPLTGEVLARHEQVKIFPAKHFITEDDNMQRALWDIEHELEQRVA